MASREGGTTVTLSIPTLGPADWSDYRRRMFAWSFATAVFLAVVVVDLAMASRRNFLPLDSSVLAVNLVILARTVVAYLRARKRSIAAPWEEYASHS